MRQFPVTNFSLQYSIESGQIFRYEKVSTRYYVPLRNTLFCFEQRGDILYWDAVRLDGKVVSEEMVIHLFRLDEDYEHILDSIAVDARMIELIKKYRGLRILRQDPWECIISFLASMVSTIPKHSATLKALCSGWGKSISLQGWSTYTFPEPGHLPSETELRKLGFGFRAPYIVAANGVITDKNIEELQTYSYAECVNVLQQFQGIGPKVADCVALFSLNCLESFPVDVQIRTRMEELYILPAASEKSLREFGQAYFGQFAGYAQQFLYLLSIKKSV